MMQGIESFSLRPNLKLEEIHIVNITSLTTQVIVNICQSLCSISPTDEKVRNPNYGHCQRREPLECDSFEYILKEASTSLQQRREERISESTLFEPTEVPVSKKEEGSVFRRGNIRFFEIDSDDD